MEKPDGTWTRQQLYNRIAELEGGGDSSLVSELYEQVAYLEMEVTDLKDKLAVSEKLLSEYDTNIHEDDDE